MKLDILSRLLLCCLFATFYRDDYIPTTRPTASRKRRVRSSGAKQLNPFAIVFSGGRVQYPTNSSPQRLDLAIDHAGRIAALEANIAPGSADRVIELGGKLITSGLVDVHQHLDKSGTRRFIANPTATLQGASDAYRKFAASDGPDQIAARAERTLERCLAFGTIAIRTHTNVESGSGLRGVEAMVALRQRCRSRATLQIVAHLTSDAPRLLDQSRRWLEGAISLGVDAIGGVPQFAEEPLAFLDLLFEFADRAGLPLDLHVDEHLDGRKLLFDAIIERTRAHGMQGRVTAGHCCALSAVDPGQAKRIINALAENGIAVITLPAANLYLQGRAAEQLSPRGLTRVRELRDAGVLVAAASDNMQDPFIPTGSGDLLEIARWTLLAGHLGLQDLPQAFDMISTTPARIMNLDWGIRRGARADFLISEAEGIDDLVASGPPHRAVIVGGKLVAGAL